MLIPVTVKYQLGHEITTNWTDTSLYCPFCGESEVWVESGPGDYYAGPSHLCLACEREFNLPEYADDGHNDQRIKQIREVRTLRTLRSVPIWSRHYQCSQCRHQYVVPDNSPVDGNCPKCGCVR